MSKHYFTDKPEPHETSIFSEKKSKNPDWRCQPTASSQEERGKDFAQSRSWPTTGHSLRQWVPGGSHHRRETLDIAGLTGDPGADCGRGVQKKRPQFQPATRCLSAGQAARTSSTGVRRAAPMAVSRRPDRLQLAERNYGQGGRRATNCGAFLTVQTWHTMEINC